MKKIFLFIALISSVLSYGQNTHIIPGDSTSIRHGFSGNYSYNTKGLVYEKQNKKEGYLGTIYQKASWANTNDFAVNGTATIANSGGHQNLGGGAGTFTATIDIKPNATAWITRLQYWKIVAKMVCTGQGNGVGFGIVSTNGWASNNWNVVARVDLRNVGNQQMIINGGSGYTAAATGSSLGASVAVNDTIYLTVERAVNVITFTYKNKTTGVGGTLSYTYDLTDAATLYGANTGKFSIYEFGGTQELDSLAITSTEIKNAQIAVICDSKGEQWAGTVSRNFANQLNNNVPVTINMSHGSDRLVEYISAFPELKALSPKQVIIADPGRNDSASGRTHAQIKADLQTLWDSCTAYGMQPIITTPIYETSLDMSWMTTYILATFPANKIIDLWTPIKSNTATYLDADGVHPTPAGHDTIYNTILKSFTYSGGVNLGSGYIPNSTNQSTGNFNITGTGTLGTKLNVGSSSIGTGVIISDWQTATDKHIKISENSSGQMRWGAYNDAGTVGADMQIEFKTLSMSRWNASADTEAILINGLGNVFIGSNSGVGGAQTGARLDVTTSNYGVATFSGSNASGMYIALSAAATGVSPNAYIGIGSIIASAGSTDFGLRSQSNNILFGNGGGVAMGSLKNGTLILNGANAISLTDSSNGRLQIRTDALGTTQTRTSGITLFNTTAAANNAQQISPAINFNGKGYTGAASNDMWMREYMIPVQGSPVTGYITFEGAVAGGAYATNLLNIYNTGNVAIGTTTQNGLLTVAGIIAPEANGTRDIGSSSFKFQNVYAKGVVGTTTNDNAASGNDGEYVSSLVAIASGISLTTATAANVTSISLTAGDWDVTGTVTFNETSASVVDRQASISTTTATMASDGSESYDDYATTTKSGFQSLPISRVRISVASTTTVYLVAAGTWSAGTVKASGNITARRVR